MLAASKVIPTLLREYGAQVRAVLDDYLPDPTHHRLNAVLAEYPRRGGKMLRPCLLIATARAFGASLAEALHAAVALEMMHNALLVHDDIQDSSEERRGRPALHKTHGVPLALCAGDALALRSLSPLLDSQAWLDRRLILQIFEENERMSRESAEGQALDLGWVRDNVTDIDEADYFVMVLKKTCWLAFIYSCRVGALIGSRGSAELEPFIRFGFFLGTAFQIQDDVLNLIGDPADYGKEINGDLWEGKRTLMLIRLLRKATAHEHDRLVGILNRPRSERRVEDVLWMRRKMDVYGCVEYAQMVAFGLAGAALHEYDQIYGKLPMSRDKRFVRELVTWVLEREG